MLKQVGKHSYTKRYEKIGDKSDEGNSQLTLERYQLSGLWILLFEFHLNGFPPKMGLSVREIRAFRGKYLSDWLRWLIFQERSGILVETIILNH